MAFAPPFVPTQPERVPLRAITDVPSGLEVAFHEVFSPFFTHFNAMQSQLLDKILRDEQSLVVAAPTGKSESKNVSICKAKFQEHGLGTGKTVLFEMAVLALFASEDNYHVHRGKAIYLAPSKFLVMQKFQEWERKFAGTRLGLKLVEVTGDTSIGNREMAEADIILSTPEKWDSVSRKWKEMETFVCSIKLLMVDEIHFIADEERGATLEAAVCRMKSISAWKQQQAKATNQEYYPLRIIGVSATVTNIGDIGEWLVAPPGNICEFGQEFRPVPLSIQVLSGGRYTNEFAFDKGLNFKIPDLIRQHSSGRPVLVFCATRNSACQAAKQLAKESAAQLVSGMQRQLLQEHAREIGSCQDKDLRESLTAGVGFHHGSIAPQDRRVVENLFLKRALLCLFATSTLAVGANLPAYLVIIKSTIQYRRVSGIAGWSEYDAHAIQQMAGRAGRPGFDTEGRVIILTQEQHVKRYQAILHVKTVVESRLPGHLTEHLNSEIVLKSIKDIESMLDWSASTFFSVRAKKAPLLYFPQLKGLGAVEASSKTDRLIRELMLSGYTTLSNAEPPLVVSKDEGGMTFESTDLGRVMAKYCVAFKTMEMFGNMLSPKTTMSELIQCLSEAQEFIDFKPRNDQKKFLEESNKKNEVVRYKIDKKVNTGGWTCARKVALLLQLSMGAGNMENAQMRSEMSQICDNASRVCEALVEFAVTMKWFSSAARAVKLCQSIKGRCWEDDKSGRLLQQLKGLGEGMSKKLVAHSPPILSLNDMDKLSVGKFEAILGRQVGGKILEELSKVPSYSIQTALEDFCIRLTIKSTCSADAPTYVHFPTLLVGMQDGEGKILEHKILSFAQTSTIEVTVAVPRQRAQQQVFIHVMNKNYVGRDGNAIVLIPGTIAALLPLHGPHDRGREGHFEVVEATKARRLSASQSLACEFAIRNEASTRKPQAIPEHPKPISSSASMLAFFSSRTSESANESAPRPASSKFHAKSDSNRLSGYDNSEGKHLGGRGVASKLVGHAAPENAQDVEKDAERKNGPREEKSVEDLQAFRYDAGASQTVRRPQRSKEVMSVVNRSFQAAGFGEEEDRTLLFGRQHQQKHIAQHFEQMQEECQDHHLACPVTQPRARALSLSLSRTYGPGCDRPGNMQAVWDHTDQPLLDKDKMTFCTLPSQRTEAENILSRAPQNAVASSSQLFEELFSGF